MMHYTAAGMVCQAFFSEGEEKILELGMEKEIDAKKVRKATKNTAGLLK